MWGERGDPLYGSGVTLPSPALLGGDQGQSEDHVASCAQWEESGLWTARWTRLGLIFTLSHFLGGAEPDQDQEGTEATRTTTPPGQHIWPVPALYTYPCPLPIYEIGCVRKEPWGKDTKLIMEEISLLLHSPKSRQMKLKDRSISRKKWKLERCI